MPKPLTIALLLLFTLQYSTSSVAQDDGSGPLFMKHLVEGEEFYEPWGIGLDFFTLDQQYKIKSLQFELPGVGLPDPSALQIENELQHFDLKLDVWLTPFLNVFGLLGHVEEAGFGFREFGFGKSVGNDTTKFLLEDRDGFLPFSLGR